jgi:hypothetical protein
MGENIYQANRDYKYDKKDDGCNIYITMNCENNEKNEDNLVFYVSNELGPRHLSSTLHSTSTHNPATIFQFDILPQHLSC